VSAGPEMTTEDAEQQSPFARPGFIVSAVVVAVIVVLGAVIGIVNANRDDGPGRVSAPSSSATPEATPSPEASEVAGGTSMCGLGEVVLTGSVSTAPQAEWAFQGTTAYPTSPEFGPGESDAQGIRYCFEHSPEGSIFAAANAVVQGSDATTSGDWIAYFLSEEAPNRDQLLNDVAAGSSASTRLNIAGFRLLNYTGDTARVDMAVRAVGSGNALNASAVYDLVWEAGDWKLLPLDPSNPLRMAEIPDTAGYITWGE
jgi:hypothetical protein